MIKVAFFHEPRCREWIRNQALSAKHILSLSLYPHLSIFCTLPPFRLKVASRAIEVLSIKVCYYLFAQFLQIIRSAETKPMIRIGYKPCSELLHPFCLILIGKNIEYGRLKTLKNDDRNNNASLMPALQK